GGVAEHLRERPVALEEPPARRRAVHAREVALEEEAIPLLRLAQARLHPLAARHVAQHRLRPGAALELDRRNVHLHVEERAVGSLSDRLEDLRWRRGDAAVAGARHLLGVSARAGREEV